MKTILTGGRSGILEGRMIPVNTENGRNKMMDDLISRKAVLDALGECPDNWEDSPEEVEAVNSWLYAMNAIGSVPSIPAVPLDKLCEWLTRYAEPP